MCTGSVGPRRAAAAAVAEAGGRNFELQQKLLHHDCMHVCIQEETRRVSASRREKKRFIKCGKLNSGRKDRSIFFSFIFLINHAKFWLLDLFAKSRSRCCCMLRSSFFCCCCSNLRHKNLKVSSFLLFFMVAAVASSSSFFEFNKFQIRGFYFFFFCKDFFCV